MFDWIGQLLRMEPGKPAGLEPAHRRRVRPRRVEARPAQNVYRDAEECRCVGPVPDPPLLRSWSGLCGRCGRKRGVAS